MPSPGVPGADDLILRTLEAVAEAVVRADAAGRVDYVNPAAVALLGGDGVRYLGRPMEAALPLIDDHPQGGRGVQRRLWECLEGGAPFTAERLILVLEKGQHLHVHLSAGPVLDAEGSPVGVVMVLRDAGELHQAERELLYQASHDSLTGLVNRREFEHRVHDAVSNARHQGESHAVCYLDLDDFKLVNDACGHLVGDELLTRLAATLRTAVRPQDTLARLGGDEFGVLIRDCDATAALARAEALCRAVDRFHFSWEGNHFACGVSVGVAMIDAFSDDVVGVLSSADSACYVAKEQGGKRVLLYQPDDAAIGLRQGEVRWVQRIQEALVEDRLCLFAQRIEPMAAPPSTGEAEAAHFYELFVRLVDPEGELVPPALFMPPAERYRLATAIDQWVVRSALEVLGPGGLGERSEAQLFSINLSGQSLGDEGFLAEVLEHLERTGFEPSRLCFEITETAAISDLSGARKLISTLKLKGVRFSLDDFGSGLSSLAYLRDLPVDFLKIDRVFAKDLASDGVSRELVRAIHKIGRALGLATVAEGVEDAMALEILEEIAVDYVQGYLLDRPRPIEDLLAEEGRRRETAEHPLAALQQGGAKSGG